MTDHAALIRSTDLASLLDQIRALPDGLEKQFVELLDVLRCSHEKIERCERERDSLKAELRKYEPSDGVMHERLAAYEAIAQAANMLAKVKAEEIIDLDDVNRWLARPVVNQARKAVKR